MAHIQFLYLTIGTHPCNTMITYHDPYHTYMYIYIYRVPISTHIIHMKQDVQLNLTSQSHETPYSKSTGPGERDARHPAQHLCTQPLGPAGRGVQKRGGSAPTTERPKEIHEMLVIFTDFTSKNGD